LADTIDRLPLRVLAVIVLYRMKAFESAAFDTLREAMSFLDDELGDVRIVLYDNTPGGQDIGVLPAGVEYKADFTNNGLAMAYNYALGIAEDNDRGWLLTLDQDTSLPIDFLQRICHAANFVAPMENVAAIVPHISSDGRALSPFTIMNRWTLTRNIPNGFVGIPLEEVYAVNSGSMLKVSALRAVGGYDPRFFLDFSDLAIYHRLHCHGMRVFVAGDIHVEHEVSGYDLKSRSSPTRYEDTYRAEEAAYDEWVGWIGRVMLTIRILHRLVYQLWRNGGSLCHFKIGVRFMFRRVIYSRVHRVESWKRSLRLRRDIKC
jgi:GT2 family glycosyltransferase